MYGGGLDSLAPLHHQPGRPLPLTGVLVRVVTAPAGKKYSVIDEWRTFKIIYLDENHDIAIAMFSSSCADTDSVLAEGI